MSKEIKLFFSVHEFFSIVLKNHISTALSLSFIVSEIVKVSHPYNKTDHIKCIARVNCGSRNHHILFSQPLDTKCGPVQKA